MQVVDLSDSFSYYDFFEKYSGSSDDYSLPMLILTSSAINVTFTSDLSIQQSGFAMEYKQIEAPSPPPPSATALECTTNYVTFKFHSGAYPMETGWVLSSTNASTTYTYITFTAPQVICCICSFLKRILTTALECSCRSWAAHNDVVLPADSCS
jgi:hypothetical protein